MLICHILPADVQCYQMGLPCLQGGSQHASMAPCLQARAKVACRRWLMQHLLHIFVQARVGGPEVACRRWTMP